MEEKPCPPNMLIFLFPLITLTAILIKLDSKGAVFFSQDRVGLNGKQFYLAGAQDRINSKLIIINVIERTELCLKLKQHL
jgi:hypothetical protein